MFALPCVPFVQYELLVQVGAAPRGSGGPASGGGGGTPPSTTQLPEGIPALTQAWNALASVDGTGALPEGGIGEVVDCIRTTARAPLLWDGYPGDAAWSSASVTKDWGAPPFGGVPWQLQQCALRTS